MGTSLAGGLLGSTWILRTILSAPMILVIPGESPGRGQHDGTRYGTSGAAQQPGLTARRGTPSRWGWWPADGVPPGRCGRPVMAGYVGLVAVIIIVIFAVGFLIGAILIVAIGIKAEDKATMRRINRNLVLREQPAGYLARGVRRLTGVGQRIDDSDADVR